jgi:glycosidase
MLWRDLEPYEDPQDAVDEALFAHYKRVVAIRNTYDALEVGEYRLLVADDEAGVLAFERRAGGQRVVVVINNGDRLRTVRVPVDAADGTRFHDALNDSRFTISRRRISFTRPDDYTVRAAGGAIEVKVGGGWGAVLVAGG